MVEQITKAGPVSPREALEKRNAALVASQVDLRAQRTIATLDGKSAPTEALRAVTDELEAVTDALDQIDREARAEVAEKALKDEKAADNRFKKKARDMASRRLVAIDDAEAAARAFVRAAKVADNLRADLQAEIQGRDMSIPIGLHRSTQTDLFSRGIAALILQEFGGPKFGEMVLNPGVRSAGTPWADIDKNTTEAITNILEKENE